MTTGTDTRRERVGALSGLVALMLSMLGFALAPFPPTMGTPIQEVVDYFGANRQGILVQSYVLLLGSAALLWFVASLHAFLGRYEGDPRPLSASVALFGVMGVTIGVFATAVPTVLALHADSGLDPILLKALFDLGAIAIPISNAPFGVLALAVGVVSLRDGAFPSWLGWLSVGLGATNIVTASGYMFQSGPLAPGGTLSNVVGSIFAFWLVSVVVTMYRRLGAIQDADGDRPGT